MAFIVGLPGGIGSAKGAVGTALERLGVAVADIDAITHQLTAAGGSAIGPIREAAGPELPIERSTARNGVPAEEVLRIMSAQVTRADGLAHATDIIENSGTVAELTNKVLRLRAKLLGLAAKAGQINHVPAIPAAGGLARATTVGRESPKHAPEQAPP